MTFKKNIISICFFPFSHCDLLFARSHKNHQDHRQRSNLQLWLWKASKSGIFPSDRNAASPHCPPNPPRPRSPARNLPFSSERRLPTGATGSQSDGRLGVNSEPGARRALSHFYLHYSNPPAGAAWESTWAHRRAPARTEREGVGGAQTARRPLSTAAGNVWDSVYRTRSKYITRYAHLS